MPLRDHFRPPLTRPHSWEGLLGCWPTVIIQHLNQRLPEKFSAEPNIHLGAHFEVDVAGVERDEQPAIPITVANSGGVVTLLWAAPPPTLTLETDLGAPLAYEVLVYDGSRARTLVAAIELVSPSNKDRPEHRRAFVAKCVAMLQQQVCVVIVDLITTRHFNLYAELLAMIDRSDPALGATPPVLYAVACRTRKAGRRPLLDTWMYSLRLGQTLPTLPLWLREDLSVPLELERSYEDTCSVLRIR